MKSLQFWTDGPSFTGLLLDFYRSGEFDKFEAVLVDGGLDKKQLKENLLF